MAKKMIFTWATLQDMLKDLQGVSAGHITLDESQKLVMREAIESFTSDFIGGILDKHLPYDESQALKELEVEEISLEIANKSPVIFSVSRKEKYEVDTAAIKAAGYKNQTDMFNVLAASSDSLYEGLFKRKSTVFFDSKKAEKVYKAKAAGSELIKVTESASLVVNKGGK